MRIKSDLKRRLEALESERLACPYCEYARAKLDSFTESQLRVLRAVLMDEKERRASRGPLPRVVRSVRLADEDDGGGVGDRIQDPSFLDLLHESEDGPILAWVPR